MKLIFESLSTTPSISETLSILMDSARICLDDIQYDETEGIVEIPMQRKELIGFRKTFLFGSRPIYSKANIDSVLIIKEVVEMNVQVNDILVNKCNSCFTVMVGLKVVGNEFYLGSLEEASGVVLCHISIKAKRINIEFVDKENTH